MMYDGRLLGPLQFWDHALKITYFAAIFSPVILRKIAKSCWTNETSNDSSKGAKSLIFLKHFDVPKFYIIHFFEIISLCKVSLGLRPKNTRTRYQTMQASTVNIEKFKRILWTGFVQWTSFYCNNDSLS